MVILHDAGHDDVTACMLAVVMFLPNFSPVFAH